MKINEVVIVEGKYDKIRVLSAVDATVIETKGFGIFKDAEMRKLIKMYAETRGIVILTDSDSAGFVIRNHIKNIASAGKIKMAYVPQIKGKEKRKSNQGKEGLLGVEGIDNNIIIDALKKAGCSENFKKGNFSLTDLYNLNLMGGENSKERRKRLMKALGLPEKLSNTALVDAINSFSSFEEVENILDNI
jgi:ribonuclease M5